MSNPTPPSLALPPIAAQSHTWEHLGGVGLLLIAALVWILWPIVAWRHWQNVVETKTRLGYFIADMSIVAPLCATAGYGYVRDLGWAPGALLIAVGAAAFDLTHTFIFVAQLGLPKIKGSAPPWWAYALLIVLVLSLLGLIAWRALLALVAPEELVYLVLGTMLAGALAGAALIGAKGGVRS
jgi:hypothetical protein